VRPEFFRFSKKAQDEDKERYIFFVKIRPTVIEILTFNTIFKIFLSRSVQTPNSDKNWQTSCPMQTFVCNMSRHLEFIIEQGRRVNWVSGLLDSRVTGSHNVTQFRVWLTVMFSWASFASWSLVVGLLEDNTAVFGAVLDLEGSVLANWFSETLSDYFSAKTLVLN